LPVISLKSRGAVCYASYNAEISCRPPKGSYCHWIALQARRFGQLQDFSGLLHRLLYEAPFGDAARDMSSINLC